MTEAFAEEARRQVVEAWRAAWWSGVPHSDMWGRVPWFWRPTHQSTFDYIGEQSSRSYYA